MSILVIDVGTSGLRAAIVRDDASIHCETYVPSPPSSPAPGLVEFDAAALADQVLEMATFTLDAGGPVSAVGIATQRASTVVWERATGRPVGPGLGWQDLRTVVDCIVLKAEHGIALAPNQTATKARWLLDAAAAAGHDRKALCVGTVDSWLAWVLSGGALHVTDRTNAATTGLCRPDASRWSSSVCEVMGIPEASLPQLVDTSARIGEASRLPGSPLIACLVGDQQSSLVGQGCVHPGLAKITFGTGGMLDVCTDGAAPASAVRDEHGTFPIVAWSREGATTWGIEAIMLAAGSNVDWLRDDLGVITTSPESHDVAHSCPDTDGVVYVPALLGLGTPHWDYGARGTLLGVTRGTTRAHLVRAVLEGVAHRGADLLESAEAAMGGEIEGLRVDGGMSTNPTFVQALADATGRTVEVSPVTEATTLGAAFLAGLEVGTWSSFDDVAATWRPRARVAPRDGYDRARARAVWREGVARATGWIPELSALDF
jgi:glycerol kinase